MTQNDQRMQNGPQAFFQTLKMVIDNHDHLVNSFEIWYLSRPQELKKIVFLYLPIFWTFLVIVAHIFAFYPKIA